LDLDADLLPRCYESVEVTGTLTPAAAQQLGLTTDCRVIAGAGDCAAGAIGTGVVQSGLLSASIGTSGVMFVHCDKMQVDPQGRLHTFCHAVRGKWHMMGVTLTAGGALDWFAHAVCPELIKQRGEAAIAALAKEAAQVAPGCEGLFFLPYLAGERTPHADPNARGCFVGLTLKHSRAHMVRAIMEGTCYALRDSLEIMNALDVTIRKIRVTGGGARSALWRQLQADIFGRRVFTLNAEQGPAFGVALLAAVAAGEFKDIREACNAVLKTKSETAPLRGGQTHYNRAFPVFQSLYDSLHSEFAAIKEL
jgi:xylulokinase